MKVRRAAETEAQRIAREKALEAPPTGLKGAYESYLDFNKRLEQGKLFGDNARKLGDRNSDWRTKTGALTSLGSQAADLALRRNQLSRELRQQQLERLQNIVDNAQGQLDNVLNEFDRAVQDAISAPGAFGYEAEFARIKEQINSGGSEDETETAFEELKNLLDRTASERRSANAEAMQAARRVAGEKRRAEQIRRQVQQQQAPAERARNGTKNQNVGRTQVSSREETCERLFNYVNRLGPGRPQSFDSVKQMSDHSQCCEDVPRLCR